MAVPALVFVAINAGSPESIRGWAIPAATDIAFALGLLALLGSRVPVALKALLLAIAIIDDIGAIAIIALFYTEDMNLAALGLAMVPAAGMLLLNRMGIARTIPYFPTGRIPLDLRPQIGRSCNAGRGVDCDVRADRHR